MTKILVDVDDAALQEAADVFGTHTKKETVNTALRLGAEQLRRARALETLTEMGERGDYEILERKESYRS